MRPTLAACIAGVLIINSFSASPSAALREELRSTANARIELGQALFFDRRLSDGDDISCASCHAAEHAFADARATSIGSRRSVLTRNAPSLLDVADRKTLFWDGRAESLEEQAAQPLFNPLEHGLASEQAMLDIVRADPAYEKAFAQAFPDAAQMTVSTLVAAIVSYERTLASADNAFDRHLRGEKDDGLSDAALRGWNVFRGEAHCTQCHRVEGARPALTDDDFHPSPLGFSNTAAVGLPDLIRRVEAARASNGPNAAGRLVSSDRDVASLGRFVATANPKDIGLFRTPSLRNVALTAPYMHDGSVATLEAAVELELYREDGQVLKPITLAPQEKADLIAFLQALGPPVDSK